MAAGRDALLTCVVNNLGNHTLLWKKVQDRDGVETMAILTAGAYRVTKDSRVMVLHDSGKPGIRDVAEVVGTQHAVIYCPRLQTGVVLCADPRREHVKP